MLFFLSLPALSVLFFRGLISCAIPFYSNHLSSALSYTIPLYCIPFRSVLFYSIIFHSVFLFHLYFSLTKNWFKFLIPYLFLIVLRERELQGNFHKLPFPPFANVFSFSLCSTWEFLINQMKLKKAAMFSLFLIFLHKLGEMKFPTSSSLMQFKVSIGWSIKVSSPWLFSASQRGVQDRVENREIAFKDEQQICVKFQKSSRWEYFRFPYALKWLTKWSVT